MFAAVPFHFVEFWCPDRPGRAARPVFVGTSPIHGRPSFVGDLDGCEVTISHRGGDLGDDATPPLAGVAMRTRAGASAAEAGDSREASVRGA
ncbi:hypothetical protein NL676_034731 [Syzygium grande]|nr:hypothetical protein NL676_034731 [Syzygium grande]